MQPGRDLQSLAAELGRQAETARDYLVPAPALRADVVDAQPVLRFNSGGDIVQAPMTRHARRQLGAWLDIPGRYVDRMAAEAPDLLADNANRWIGEQPTGTTRLIRQIDDEATLAPLTRALVSDSYRPLDNVELAEAVLPTLIDMGADVMSSQITETRFHLQASFPSIEGDVKVGDPVRAGIAISNSEVGAGSMWIAIMIWRLVCSNGMVLPRTLSKTHLGSKQSAEITRMLSSETREQRDRALWMTVRDTTKALTSGEEFQRTLAKLKNAAVEEISPKADIEKVVETAVRVLKIGTPRKAGLLQAFARGGDMTKWGLANAVTSLAHDTEIPYDEAVDIEKAGHKVITLNRRDWNAISEAA